MLGSTATTNYSKPLLHDKVSQKNVMGSKTRENPKNVIRSRYAVCHVTAKILFGDIMGIWNFGEKIVRFGGTINSTDPKTSFKAVEENYFSHATYTQPKESQNTFILLHVLNQIEYTCMSKANKKFLVEQISSWTFE